MFQRCSSYLPFNFVFRQVLSARVKVSVVQALLKGLFKGTFRSLFRGWLLWLIALSVVISVLVSAPAVSAATLASIHTYHENPGQTTFRSKQSLRDRSDRAWQIILFKRYQADELQGLYLRLVGFPGVVSLSSQKPLIIATGASAQWSAPPKLDPQTQSLPENAAQYEVFEAITALAGDIPLQIAIPLADGSTAELVVPPFAVHEWRDLSNLNA
jgi:hypothetical protein